MRASVLVAAAHSPAGKVLRWWCWPAEVTRFAGQMILANRALCEESSVGSGKFLRRSVISVRAVNSDPTQLGFGFLIQ